MMHMRKKVTVITMVTTTAKTDSFNTSHAGALEMTPHKNKRRTRKAKKELKQAALLAVVLSAIASVCVGGTMWYVLMSVSQSRHVHVDLGLVVVEVGLLCFAVWSIINWLRARRSVKACNEGVVAK